MYGADEHQPNSNLMKIPLALMKMQKLNRKDAVELWSADIHPDRSDVFISLCKEANNAAIALQRDVEGSALLTPIWPISMSIAGHKC